MALKRNAFTLVELLIVVLIMAALAFVSVPRLKYTTLYRKQADTVARKIVTDLRRTRRLAISNAATNTAGYRLKMSISSPYTSYEIENQDTAEIIDTHTIDSAVSCTGDNNFKFGPLGNLIDPGQDQLTVSAEGKTFTITIIPATGTIKCVEN